MKNTDKTAPSHIAITKYFFILGLDERHADAFYYLYSMREWKLDSGQPVKNWKALAFNWVCSFSKSKPLQKKSIRC